MIRQEHRIPVCFTPKSQCTLFDLVQTSVRLLCVIEVLQLGTETVLLLSQQQSSIGRQKIPGPMALGDLQAHTELTIRKEANKTSLQ